MTSPPPIGAGYDVIVVGAGGSGAPLAARLSADADRSVLLLEAGPAPLSLDAFPPELVDAGTLRGADPRHPDDWAFAAHLTPDRPYAIARGRIAGGSTTINGGYFIRARDEDFVRWSANGCDAWRPENVHAAQRRLESDREYGSDTTRHGADGPMPVTRPADRNPAARAFRAAALGLGYPDEPDKNAQAASGVGPVPCNVVDGVRVNTALAYLTPIVGRPNLTVLGHAFARRVLFDGTTAIGVELEHGGAVKQILGREIVVSAGALQTPHLLMLSGIGPRDELETHGIEVLIDAQRVGKGFSDHPQIALEWYPVDGVTDLSGPALGDVLNVDIDGEAGAEIEILQMLKPVEHLLTGSAPPGAPLSLLVSVQSAVSRGDIALASSDPLTPPAIDYHYLSTEPDRGAMRTAVRIGVRLLESRPFRAAIARRGEPDAATLADDAALDGWILEHLGTSIHTCGSVAFGADADAVVDQYGCVRGVNGLRVADTSILPTTTTRGPAATAVLIGELVSDFIRRGD